MSPQVVVTVAVHTRPSATDGSGAASNCGGSVTGPVVTSGHGFSASAGVLSEAVGSVVTSSSPRPASHQTRPITSTGTRIPATTREMLRARRRRCALMA